MPKSSKVAWSQLKVGVMALLALIILFVLVFLLTGADNPFTDKATLYTFMRDSGAMTEGAAVRLNGILIGKVTHITLTGDANVERTIRMKMEVHRDLLSRIPDDSLIGFSSENVLGAKFLNIQRGKSATPVKDGGELRSRDDTDFLEIAASAMPLLESLRSILTRIDKVVAVVERGEGSIGKLINDEEVYNRVNRVLGNVDRVTAAVEKGEGTLGKLIYDASLHDDLRRTLARVDNIAAGLERGEGTAGKLLKDPAMYDDLRKSSSELRVLLSDLNAGKGTAGKLLKDEGLHNRLTGTLDRLNGAMDRINAGQGTLGQLMVNPALYENLTGTTAEMHALMKDFRANPKKFLTIQLKLF